MFTEIFNLLISTAFYFYIAIVFLRFLLQYIRADFYNPISLFIVKATDPVLKPLQNILPSSSRVNTAALLLILLLKILELGLSQMVNFGGISSYYILFAQSILQLVKMFLNFYLFAIFGQIILSWVAPQNYNPVVALLYQITEPIMAPARKLIPGMGGMDFSPILVIVGIQVLEIILVSNKGVLPMLFSSLQPFFS